MKKPLIPILGLICVALYFLSVALFLITKTELSLSVWEWLTILSAPIVLFVLLDLAKLLSVSDFAKSAMLVFASAMCVLTGLAHIINLTVTRPLIASGVDVPDYLRIGVWPSAEMAVDYLGWGFFAGLAFLSVGIAAHSVKKRKKIVKYTSIICGALCLIGFFGTVFVNENLWYIAPVGYGLGSGVLCVFLLKTKEEKQ